MTPSDPLVICTAWNSAFAELGKLCSESIAQHIKRVEERGGSGLTMVTRLIPDDYPRPASWWKIGFIRELLETNPNVLWIDCDALLIDRWDIREIPCASHIHADLMIANDDNGINCGVMQWKASEKSKSVLEQIENSYEQYKDHKWWEQASLMDILNAEDHDPLNVYYVKKAIWNCYTDEINPDTCIVHYPGFFPEEKLKLMEAQEIAIRRNGHGPK